jgi:hypothetical protein
LAFENGGSVELQCACGFTLMQAQRDPIPERCPRCRERW